MIFVNFSTSFRDLQAVAHGNSPEIFIIRIVTAAQIGEYFKFWLHITYPFSIECVNIAGVVLGLLLKAVCDLTKFR